MNKELDEKLKFTLSLLTQIVGFDNFFDNYTQTNKVTNKKDLVNMVKSFEAFCTVQGNLNEKEKVVVSHTIELMDYANDKENPARLSRINHSLKYSDQFIQDFLNDFEKCITGDRHRINITKNKYKTIREQLIMHETDGKQLLELYKNYQNHNHPFIYYTISEPFINAKNYSIGIEVLKRALKYAFKYPNHFWNNEYGVEGLKTYPFSSSFKIKLFH